MRRARLDAELVRRGLARSREHAGELIAAARVTIGGRQASKAATAVEPGAALLVRPDGNDENWASRGAHKLLGAIAAFPDVHWQGRRVLDAGASTGGFTDVLLRHGVSRVVAVDVGYGQLVWRLQNDERVQVHDRTNVRTLTPDDIGGPVDAVVADLSFISLTLVLPALIRCTRDDGDLVLMVKPQFEVGRTRLGAGGVVRDPELRVEAIVSVVQAAARLGWRCAGVSASPLPGPSGNVEYFVHLRAAHGDDGSVHPDARSDAVDDELRQRIVTAVRQGPQ